jgi:hypothetical protein
MNTHSFSDTLSTVMRELVRGSPDLRDHARGPTAEDERLAEAALKNES